MKALWLQLDELIKATIHFRFLEPSDNCAALAVSPNANVPTLGLVATQAVLPGDRSGTPTTWTIVPSERQSGSDFG